MKTAFPALRPGQPALVLAPMEGVTDAPMREFMTERGGFTFCVAEFFRITDPVPPARVLKLHVPELLRPGCVTASGTPVQVQLLGGNPEALASAARMAVGAGAPAIDLNFGCPAPTVNRHDGGATLLKHPERIEAIVRAVRTAVPPEIPVSAKLRLGWDSTAPARENAERAARGGASWITLHARTRMQAYQPPVYWEAIGEVRRALGGEVPVVANGDIWSLEDLKRCQELTECEHFMLGRSALADPNLPLLAARHLGLPASPSPLPVPSRLADGPFSTRAPDWTPLLRRFTELSLPYAEGASGYVLKRVKQWVKMSHQHRAPIEWFDPLKRTQSLEEAFELLARTPL